MPSYGADMGSRNMLYQCKSSQLKLCSTLLAAAAILVVAAAAPATAAASTGRSKHAESDESGAGAAEPDAGAAFWPGRKCKFKARAHNPHKSSNGVDASGHGNWENTSKNKSDCPDKAEVTVELQAYMCRQVLFWWDCSWQTMAEKTAHKYSKRQVPVHYPCHSDSEAGWRTKVTVRVSISGWFDKTAVAYNSKNFKCSLGAG